MRIDDHVTVPEDNFKNPDQFLPDRWLDVLQYAPHSLEAFIPFSYGLGVCTGKQLALQNMKYVGDFFCFSSFLTEFQHLRLLAASIIRSFDLSIPSGFDIRAYDESYKVGL